MTKRLKLSLLYLLPALVTLTLGIILMKVFWYPYPLMQAAGVTKLFSILAVVNIILAFTFAIMIFRNSKKDFKKDMLISMMMQSIFFAISVYGLYQIRPVWMAYNVDRFELILNNDLVSDNVYKADRKYRQPSFLLPRYVGVSFSQDNEERTQNLFDEVLNSISTAQRPERYVPFAQVNKQVKNRAQDLKLLETYNDKNKVETLLKKYPQANSFVPLQAKAIDMTVLLDNESENQVVAIVDLRPW